MKVVFLAIGKRHDTDFEAAINDYFGRLQKYCQAEWQIIPSLKADFSPAEQRKRESLLLAAQIRADDYVVLLDETGKQLTSPELAGLLEQRTTGRLLFVIGGAYGVSDELKTRANVTWSLSKLVFPHQMVRLILAEQAYRAFTIAKGERYHHS